MQDEIALPFAVNNNKSDLFNLIGSYMITVFNDAKRISLSRWSWPSREIANQMSYKFKISGQSPNISSTNLQLHYLSPGNHKDFLESIVQSDLGSHRDKIRQSLAVSARVDGSTDRTQQHNIFAMVNIVNNDKDITTSTLFIGFGIPKKGRVSGYLECLKRVTENVIPWEEFLHMVTSLMTDGEYINTGRLTGLCVQLKNERLNSNPSVPLFSIWCLPHRINLVWKTLSKISIIANIITAARKLSKHFRKSGTRTYKLKEIAAAHNLNTPLTFPAFFAVRWCEYVFNLFHAILRNWRACAKYFNLENLKENTNTWLNYDKLHLLTFLADVLSLLKSFQKTCQSDTICITDVLRLKADLLTRFETCKTEAVPDGWEKLFLENVVKRGDKYYLFGYHLQRPRPRVTPNRLEFSFTTNKRQHIMSSLILNLNLRLRLDDPLQQKLAPLTKITSETTQQDLLICYSFIAKDMDKRTFLSDYYEAADFLKDYEFVTPLETLRKLNVICPERLQTIKLALARIVAAKPNSADVERLICAYNKFKRCDRYSLSPETISNYLHVNTNMNTLDEFDPVPAVQHWMGLKDRRPKTSSRARDQEWYKGVFKQTSAVKRKRHPKIEF